MKKTPLKMPAAIPDIHRIHLPETDSTNTVARNLAPSIATSSSDSLCVVTTDYQTAGRGQRGNTWEAERDKNLLFSIVLCPCDLPAARQFAVCEHISVVLCEVLSRYTSDIRIKWPNDIYYRDHKLCGILIEHDIEGTRIARTIIGAGLNVNQSRFVSDAPNPISLSQILGHEIDREELLDAICRRFVTPPPSAAALHNRYNSLLYRRDTPAPYRDSQGTFTATLLCVEEDGHLILEDMHGELRRYLFKEVAYIL